MELTMQLMTPPIAPVVEEFGLLHKRSIQDKGIQ
jgi:hypothetical protein